MNRILYGYNGQRIRVSAEDYELLATRRWSTTARYARAMWWGKSVPMHRIVLENKLGRELLEEERVDHINGDGFDNRRENLRLATPLQNAWNSRPQAKKSSKYMGVHFRKDYGVFESVITNRGQRIGLGYYDDEVEAAYIRDQFALALRGEFAYLNFLGE